MLDNLNMIHMNGRLYDPVTGRFASPDPIVQDLGMSQSLNPYSYVMNQPLSLTDPSGYCWTDSYMSYGPDGMMEVGPCPGMPTIWPLDSRTDYCMRFGCASLNPFPFFGWGFGRRTYVPLTVTAGNVLSSFLLQVETGIGNKTTNWLCERGNGLASASENFSMVSGPLELIGLTAAPFTEGPTLPLAAAGGFGNELAGYAQMAAGVLQGIDTGSYSNLINGGIAMGTGKVLTRGIIPSPSGRASQRALDGVLKNSRIVSGGIYDALITIVDDLAPHQVKCSGAGQ